MNISAQTAAPIEGNYLEVRDSIQDGDLLYIRDGTSIWSRLTQLITRSPHYHVGVAVWMTDGCARRRLMILEAHLGGRRLVTLSTYTPRGMDVIRPIFDFGTYSDEFIEFTGKVPYSLPDYLAVGMLELLRIRLGNFRGEVCSELVSDYLARSPAFADIPAQSSPGKQYKWLAGHHSAVYIFAVRASKVSVNTHVPQT